MPHFYYTRDLDNPQWLNLDHISFVTQEKDRLVLKMSSDVTIVVGKDDVESLTELLTDHTVNFYQIEYDAKPYNHEEGSTKEEIDASKKEFGPEDWDPKDLSLDDEDDRFYFI